MSSCIRIPFLNLPREVSSLPCLVSLKRYCSIFHHFSQDSLLSISEMKGYHSTLNHNYCTLKVWISACRAIQSDEELHKILPFTWALVFCLEITLVLQRLESTLCTFLFSFRKRTDSQDMFPSCLDLSKKHGRTKWYFWHSALRGMEIMYLLLCPILRHLAVLDTRLEGFTILSLHSFVGVDKDEMFVATRTDLLLSFSLITLTKAIVDHSLKQFL